MKQTNHSSKYRYIDHVYAVRRANGDIKIGHSWNVGSRIANIRSKHGDVDVIGVVRGGRELEAELHRQFAAFRQTIVNKRGQTMKLEWFSPAIELYAFIYEHMERYETYADQMRRMGHEGAARNSEKARGRKRITDWQAAQPSEQEAA